MPDPSILDANAAENWRKLPMQFEIYLVAKGKDDKVDKLKVQLFMTLCWARSRRRIQPLCVHWWQEEDCHQTLSVNSVPIYPYFIKQWWNMGLPTDWSPHVRESKTILDSGFQILDSSFGQWNLDPGFQTLVGFQIPSAVLRIPKSRIPDSRSKKFSRISDSTSKTFTDSGIRIPLQGARFTYITTGSPNSRYEESLV